MALETLLFPVGPLDLGAGEMVGLLISTPGQDVVAVWSYNWDDAFEQAIGQVANGDWVTVTRMEDVVAVAKDRGRALHPDHAICLARIVGDLYDHTGFAKLKCDMNAYALMRAMAEYLTSVAQMSDGRSQPVVIDIKDDTDRSMFVAGMGRDGHAGYLYITQTPEMLVKLIETSFGMDLPDWVGFVMARVEPGEGWIGQATHDLFGVSFQPMIRTRTTDGQTCAVFEERVQFLIVALFRAADIARGAVSATGKVALHNWAPEVEMWRFDP